MAVALASGCFLGLILSAASPALAEGPTGNKLRWLPYRASSGDAHGRVTVAARDAQPRLDPSYNPVRQSPSRTNPFDDPFGDGSGRSQHPKPVAMMLQAGSGPGETPATEEVPKSGETPKAVAAPSASGQPEAGAVPEAPPAPATAPAGMPDAKAAPAQPALLDTEQGGAYECRTLKDLAPISELNNSMAIDTVLPIPKSDDETLQQRRQRKVEKDKVLREAQAEVAKYACPLEHGAAPLRDTIGWQPVTFTWKASGLCHKPLYFEQAHVERYGHSTGPITQPLVSGAMFFLTVPILPYEMGLHPPYECIYSLGYYRPGSCAPYYLEPVPLSLRAGLIEAGAWLGGVYILP